MGVHAFSSHFLKFQLCSTRSLALPYKAQARVETACYMLKDLNPHGLPVCYMLKDLNPNGLPVCYMLRDLNPL